MTKKIKAIGLALLGLIIWAALVWAAIAFLKVEANPFSWSEGVRAFFLFGLFCYMAFIPVMVMYLENEV